jgi:hypothetical protein
VDFADNCVASSPRGTKQWPCSASPGGRSHSWMRRPWVRRWSWCARRAASTANRRAPSLAAGPARGQGRGSQAAAPGYRSGSEARRGGAVPARPGHNAAVEIIRDLR